MFEKLPTVSMYGIFPYVWLIFMLNVGKYTHTWILWIISKDCMFEKLDSVSKGCLQIVVEGLYVHAFNQRLSI